MKTAFLIDMDGVIYKGDHIIEGADRFIQCLQKQNIPFLFITNNSRSTKRDIVHRLHRMGIDVTAANVFTSALATAQFLSLQNPNGTAFVVGEGGLLNALDSHGYAINEHDPDYVVVGETRLISMEQIDKAVDLVFKGAKLIATNLDSNCPTHYGIRPGCGAIVAMIEKATNKKAFSIGKPSPVMMRMARKILNIRTDETVLIGDMMNTDILGGVQVGYRTILVLSGGTQESDLSHYSYQPSQIVGSIADLIAEIEPSSVSS